MKKYTLILDLKKEQNLIDEYEKYHKNVPQDIQQSLKDAGIFSMEIHRFRNRLVMNLEVEDNFSFERKAELDLKNPAVQAWEKTMWNFQDSIPGAPENVKWVLTEKIFDFKS